MPCIFLTESTFSLQEQEQQQEDGRLAQHLCIWCTRSHPIDYHKTHRIQSNNQLLHTDQHKFEGSGRSDSALLQLGRINQLHLFKPKLREVFVCEKYIYVRNQLITSPQCFIKYAKRVYVYYDITARHDEDRQYQDGCKYGGNLASHGETRNLRYQLLLGAEPKGWVVFFFLSTRVGYHAYLQDKKGEFFFENGYMDKMCNIGKNLWFAIH